MELHIHNRWVLISLVTLFVYILGGHEFPYWITLVVTGKWDKQEKTLVYTNTHQQGSVIQTHSGYKNHIISLEISKHLMASVISLCSRRDVDACTRAPRQTVCSTLTTTRHMNISLR